jgi:hypothetical protein
MFTNWLTSETSNKSRENNLHPPPDVIVEIGLPTFTRYPAHASILSAHSGFLRAAIIRASEAGKLTELPIYIPNITNEHFSPLLTYMYTGYLDLNYENIFGVLLATHLLHMPRALEICRDFLAQTQRTNDFYSSAVPVIPSPSTMNSTSKVIKPIASKASNMGLNFVSPPKNSSNLLVASHGTPFKMLSCEESKNSMEIEKVEQRSKVNTPKPIPVNAQTPPRKLSEQPSTNSNASVSENEKVIIDIASCDGPVKFRRVLNDAFEKNKKQTFEPSSSDILSDFKYQPSVYASFHQQMIRNIDEQYKQHKTLSNEESENSQHSNDVFTCVYCNLTFKSKYCYQKHAKRHLNPLNSLPKSDCESSDGDSRKNHLKDSSTLYGKRDMKPLDMNVQYYPCKTCGCKFPSYYFVHKHRKMCHPEIGDTTQNNELESKEECTTQTVHNETK